MNEKLAGKNFTLYVNNSFGDATYTFNMKYEGYTTPKVLSTTVKENGTPTPLPPSENGTPTTLPPSENETPTTLPPS